MTIKEINNLINEEKKRTEEENKAARQEFEKEMKAFYSAILIFEETPNASPISAIKNSTDVPP